MTIKILFSYFQASCDYLLGDALTDEKVDGIRNGEEKVWELDYVCSESAARKEEVGTEEPC